MTPFSKEPSGSAQLILPVIPSVRLQKSFKELPFDLRKIRSSTSFRPKTRLRPLSRRFPLPWPVRRPFTATSGPGFSLMQEALGWGHVVEAPCVFVNAMRVGPSTGMPTQPAQSDLLQIKAGSAGDYYPIAFYPQSVEECFRLTVTAFNAAEESLSPVILLADAFLSHLYELVDLEKIETEIIPRSKGPLGKGQRLFTGTAHDKIGNVKTSDPVIYREWLGEVKDRRLPGPLRNILFFSIFPCKDSNILLIAFGITSRIISALKERFSIFRPIRIYPVLEKELREVTQSYPRIIVIEGSDGQYASWVEWAIGRKVMKVPCLGGGFKLKWIQSQIEDRLEGRGKMTDRSYKELLKMRRFPHTWCPGCGIGSVLKNVAMVMKELGWNDKNTVAVSGIGCSGRMSGYMNLDAVHTPHGRALTAAETIKTISPDLNVVVLSGDGDFGSIGGNHLLHTSRRNADITVFCNDNEILWIDGWAIAGPTTPRGTKTITSHPGGSITSPFD